MQLMLKSDVILFERNKVTKLSMEFQEEYQYKP